MSDNTINLYLEPTYYVKSLADPMVTHSGFEGAYFAFMVVIAAVCFALSRLYKNTDYGLYFYTGVGFASSAFVTIFHILLPWNYPELVETWVPVTWALERSVIFTSMLVGMLRLIFKAQSSNWWALLMPIGTLGLLVLATATGSFNWANSETQWLGFLVLRPLDITMLALIVADFMLTFHPAVRGFMPRRYHWLYIISAWVHITMGLLSVEVFDDAFFIAHLMKISENVTYGYALLAGLFLVLAGNKINGSVNDDLMLSEKYERNRKAG